MTITPLGPTTGVEIAGLSGRQLVDRVVADRCRAALNEYGVVIYREVDVDDEGLIAFSRLLGDVVPLPRGGHELPEIQTITRGPSECPVLGRCRPGGCQRGHRADPAPTPRSGPRQPVGARCRCPSRSPGSVTFPVARLGPRQLNRACEEGGDRLLWRAWTSDSFAAVTDTAWRALATSVAYDPLMDVLGHPCCGG